MVLIPAGKFIMGTPGPVADVPPKTPWFALHATPSQPADGCKGEELPRPPG